MKQEALQEGRAKKWLETNGTIYNGLQTSYQRLFELFKPVSIGYLITYSTTKKRVHEAVNGIQEVEITKKNYYIDLECGASYYIPKTVADYFHNQGVPYEK